ncbi:MAG TPA: phage tail tip lysozyme, partial [Candidatus Saccharimonadales bacterium]
ANQVYAVDTNFFAGNDILFYDPTCAYTGSTDSLSGSDIPAKVWNFLKGQGLSDEQTAGVMGNMQAESNMVPTRHQSSGNNVYADGGSGNAWGLSQWDGSRRYTSPDKGILGKLKTQQSALIKYTDIQYDWIRNQGAQAKIPPADLDSLTLFELNYLVQESKSRPVTAKGYGDAGSEWNTLKQQKNIEDATVFWHNNFEVSADSPQQVISNRGGAAKDFYNKFAGKSTGTSTSTGSTSSSSSAGSAQAPVVFLDPGHGGAISPYIDPQSGLKTAETYNTPETENVLDVANRVKTALEGAGYQVVMSRTTNSQQVKFRDRSNAAEAAKASIGVSIHTTPGDINQAWPQRVGTYRQYNGHKDTFTNQTTAQKSEAYASIFAKTRTASENHSVTTDPGNTQELDSFSRSGIDSKGNIPLIALWAPDVPWVYNEIGQDQSTAISDQLKQKYADGIIKGVEEALPYTKKDQCGNTVAVSGDFDKKLLDYAWPDYRGKTTAATPLYTSEVINTKDSDRYIGGTTFPGIDCGGFVTNLLINSGFEPKYNYGGSKKNGAGPTGTQDAWASKNWQTLGKGGSVDVAKLQKGDVAISGTHTFVFVGNVANFQSNRASASLNERAPMAGKESLVDSAFTWYRKK